MTQRYYRRVIRITAEDSPNVQAKRDILPGVLTYREYQKRLNTWDEVRKTIGLWGQFYEGAELLLFPPEWLNRAELLARQRSYFERLAERWMGCDPGEGGANTCWTIIDRQGILKQISRKTPDTNVIPSITLSLMNEWNVPANRVTFDAGGGGKIHADRLKAKGFSVNTVGFGESVGPEIKRGIHTMEHRQDIKEDRYAYKNRRAQMYGDLSELFDPINVGFCLHPEYAELRRQLALMPKLFDDEGRMYLPPKKKRDDKDTRKTLTEIIGRSPDEADSLVVAVYGMLHAKKRAKASVG